MPTDTNRSLFLIVKKIIDSNKNNSLNIELPRFILDGYIYETTFCTSVNSYLFYTKMLLWNKLALNYFSKYDPSIQKTINFILIDKKKCEEFIKKNQSAYEVD